MLAGAAFEPGTARLRVQYLNVSTRESGVIESNRTINQPENDISTATGQPHQPWEPDEF